MVTLAESRSAQHQTEPTGLKDWGYRDRLHEPQHCRYRQSHPLPPRAIAKARPGGTHWGAARSIRNKQSPIIRGLVRRYGGEGGITGPIQGPALRARCARAGSLPAIPSNPTWGLRPQRGFESLFGASIRNLSHKILLFLQCLIALHAVRSRGQLCRNELCGVPILCRKPPDARRNKVSSSTGGS